jgi:hypothetical protein
MAKNTEAGFLRSAFGLGSSSAEIRMVEIHNEPVEFNNAPLFEYHHLHQIQYSWIHPG